MFSLSGTTPWHVLWSYVYGSDIKGWRVRNTLWEEESRLLQEFRQRIGGSWVNGQGDGDKEHLLAGINQRLGRRVWNMPMGHHTCPSLQRTEIRGGRAGLHVGDGRGGKMSSNMDILHLTCLWEFQEEVPSRQCKVSSWGSRDWSL